MTVSSDALDLREQISNAWDEQEKADATPPAETGTAPSAPDAAAPVDPQAAPATDDRPRDPATGRFAPKAQDAPADPKLTASPEGKPAPAVPEQKSVPEPSAVERPWLTGAAPPPGWSPTAKAEWQNLPQHVREAIGQRETQMQKGMEKIERYKDLDQYDSLARNSGTTISEAFGRYVSAEQALNDPKTRHQAFLWLFNEYDINPAVFLEGQHQGQDAQPQTHQQVHQGLPPEVIERLDRIEGMFTGQRTSAVNSELARFAADPAHTYFHNVEDRMADLILLARQNGQEMSLQDAYESACWADPEIRTLLIKGQQEQTARQAAEAAEAAKRAAGSLPTGSPLNGARERASAGVNNRRADIAAAWDQHT